MATWEWWGKRRLFGFLGGLVSAPEDGKVIFCPPGHSLESLHPPSAQALALLGDAAPRALEWPMGVVCFWAPEQQMWVLPPFAVARAEVESTWHSPAFDALYRRPVCFGLLLLRRGGYAIGVARGEALERHKVGTRYVQGRHRAGGSSAQRFERRRREQVHHLLQEVCLEAGACLKPYLPSLETLFLGGDRLLLGELLKGCAFLQQAALPVHPHRLSVPEPRLRVLEGAIELAWQSRVTFTGAWKRAK